MARSRLAATHRRDQHQDNFAFRVFGEEQAGQQRVRSPSLIRSGLTSAMLANLGYRIHSWNGADGPLVVIGRNALKDDAAMAAQAGALFARWRSGFDLFSGPRMDYTRSWVARVPKGRAARLPGSFCHASFRTRPSGFRRPPRLDGQQHPD